MVDGLIGTCNLTYILSSVVVPGSKAILLVKFN